MDRLSELQDLSLTSDTAQQILKNVHTAVSQGQVTVLAVIESLGFLLTHSDPFTRCKGVHVMAYILKHLNASQISKSQASVILNFFLDRLYDKPSVADVLNGVASLLENQVLHKTDIPQIGEKIFAELSVQSFQHTVRYSVLLVLDFVLRQSHDLIKKEMNDAFLFGYIQSLDGEKDPRNLLLAFGTIECMAQQLDLTKHAEDLFDVFYCYFPITFRPPPNDPHGITAEDLRLALKKCIAAHPDFAAFSMSLLIEKLTSSSTSAKRDAMDALTASFPVYGFLPALEHKDELWKLLKEEVFQPSDEGCEQASLICLEALCKSLSQAPSSPDRMETPLESLLGKAIQECMSHLETPGVKLARPSGKLLEQLSSSCLAAYEFIIEKTIPDLLTIMKKDTMITSRKTILEILVEFVSIGRRLYGSIDKDRMEEDIQHPILAFKDILFEELTSNVSPRIVDFVPLTCVAVKGLVELSLSKGVLSIQEIKHGIRVINTIVLTEPQQDESFAIQDKEMLQMLAGAALGQLASSRPDLIIETTVTDVFEHVTEHIESMAHLKQLLAVIVEISDKQDVFQVCVDRLLEKLDILSTDAQMASTYSLYILHALWRVLDIKTESQPPVTLSLTLCQHVFTHLLSKSSMPLSVAHLILISKIFTCLARFSQDEFRNTMLKSVYETLVEGKSDTGVVTSCLSASSPDHVTDKSLLVCAVLCNTRPTSLLPFQDVSTFLTRIIHEAIKTHSTTLATCIAKMVGSLVNNWSDANAMNALVSSLNKSLLESGQHGFLVYLWITKALVLQCHETGYTMFNTLVSLLDNKDDLELSTRVASSIHELFIHDQEGVLTKSSFAHVRLLYKQKLFAQCKSQLLDGYHKTATESKHLYLVAISSIIGNIPKQLLMGELNKLFPIVLNSATFPSIKLKSSAVDTLQLILRESSSMMEEHLSTLIPLLLKVASHSELDSAQVQIKALELLGQLTDTMRYDILYPHKNHLIRSLAPILDDPIRRVRSAAAHTRNKYYLLLGPKQ